MPKERLLHFNTGTMEISKEQRVATPRCKITSALLKGSLVLRLGGITSMATVNYINQFFFDRLSSIIFQWMYESQFQRMARSAFEITELLWCEFRYRP